MCARPCTTEPYQITIFLPLSRLHPLLFSPPRYSFFPVTIKLPSLYDSHCIDQQLLDNVVHDALVWASLHGLVMGDKSSKKPGTTLGVGSVHTPFALLPVSLQKANLNKLMI